MLFNIISKDNQYNEIRIDAISAIEVQSYHSNSHQKLTLEKFMVYDDFTVPKIICRVLNHNRVKIAEEIEFETSKRSFYSYSD